MTAEVVWRQRIVHRQRLLTLIERQLCQLVDQCLSLSVAHASVQPENTKLYTVENPLIYEDVCDLWPYSYQSDEGNPEGFNIDLIERLMKELNIPYVIRLKPQQEVFQDLKAGKAGLKVIVSDSSLCQHLLDLLDKTYADLQPK